MGPQEPQQPVAPPPVQPAQPVQPVMQPNTAGTVPPTPSPKKGMSKGLLWGIIGGSVGLILLIVGTILAVVLLGGPSKEDYRKAEDTLSEATTAYNKMSNDSYELMSTSATDSSRKKAIENIKKYQGEFNEKFQELGKMKGIAKDKDLKEKWDKVEERRAKFNSYAEELYEVSEKVAPLLKDISSISSQSGSSLSSLRERVEGIKVKNTATNDYLSALAKYMRAAEDYANYRSTGEYDSSAYTKYSSALNDYYDATKDWSSAIEEMSEEAELKDLLNDLRDELSDKVTSMK